MKVAQHGAPPARKRGTRNTMARRRRRLLLGLVVPSTSEARLYGVDTSGCAQYLNKTLAPIEAPMHRITSFGDAAALVEELFAFYHCKHVYLDVGTNVGMQIRKLYQPANFSRASIRPTFRHFFGRSPLCSGVCAIGMEPNPEHARRLNSLETNMRRAGAGVLYLPVAASDSTHANLTFRRAGSDHHAADCDRDAVSFSAAARERVPRSSAKDKRQEADGAGGGGVRVQSIDLSRLIELIGARLRGGGARAVNGRAPSLVMKLDTEGHEAAVVPHLIRERVALCAVDFMSIEWHERLPALDAGMRRGARAARAQLSAALSRGGSTSISCPTGRAPAKVSTMDDETYRFPKYTDNLAWPNRTLLCGAKL